MVLTHQDLLVTLRYTGQSLNLLHSASISNEILPVMIVLRNSISFKCFLLSGSRDSQKKSNIHVPVALLQG